MEVTDKIKEDQKKKKKDILLKQKKNFQRLIGSQQ